MVGLSDGRTVAYSRSLGDLHLPKTATPLTHHMQLRTHGPPVRPSARPPVRPSAQRAVL
jgi:hypothetical protein